MIINLFSTFDPTSINFNINWISTIIILLFITNILWNTSSRINALFNILYLNLSNEINTHLNSNNASIIFITIIVFIIFINLIGLTSYTFTSQDISC